jgi:hypothetical protein
MGSTDDATQPPMKVLWSPLSLSSDHGDSCAQPDTASFYFVRNRSTFFFGFSRLSIYGKAFDLWR